MKLTLTYYRCKNKYETGCKGSPSITEMKLEQYLLDNVTDALNQYLIVLSAIEANRIDHTLEIKKLKTKLERVGERYEDGDYTREEYVTKRDAIKSQIAELSSQDMPIKEAPDPLPDNWKEIYRTLDESERRLFWRSFIKKIVISRDKEPIIFFD